MNTTGSLASIPKLEAADRAADSDAPRQCPLCARTGARLWLQAPDRLHGRREQYTLLRCPDCSLVWLSEPPEPENMHLHYTEAYDKLISAGGQSSPQRWRDRRATLTQYKESGTLLDLGCSSGSFLQFMRGESWKLYGIEMSAEAARIAEERSGARVFTGTVLDASFPAGYFDLITCFDVFEHLYEPRLVMGKVAQWLRPGGIVYVLVPNIESAEARIFGSYWHGLEMPRHLFHYTPESLRRLAESSGLATVSLETHRNPAVGTSLRYVWDDLFAAIGIARTPVAYRSEPGWFWRTGRKLVRLTVLRGLLAMAPLVGRGESIHAVFQKPSGRA
jgi:SAM-dependent methyltransferase